MSNQFELHAGQYTNSHTQEESQQFTQQFEQITGLFVTAMESQLDPADPMVQDAVAQHYAFCSKFWKPTREAYKSLAMSYILPTPYKDTYEGIATGLGQYHYQAIVLWADQNLT